MSNDQLLGLAMVALFLTVVCGAVIKSLGWKEGLACITVSILGTAFIAVAFHLLKGQN